MTQIQIRGLSKAYEGKTVFENLALAVRAGETLCVMGPSGCGKTTLLRLIAGLEAPDAGEIAGANARALAFVFQEDRLISHLSALQNACLPLGRHEKGRARAALCALGLENSLNTPARALSGGMARRVAIARALLSNCDLILMDEPFKGLDEATRESAMAYVKNALDGRTLIAVTHDAREAQALGARVWRMPAPGQPSPEIPEEAEDTQTYSI